MKVTENVQVVGAVTLGEVIHVPPAPLAEKSRGVAPIVSTCTLVTNPVVVTGTVMTWGGVALPIGVKGKTD